MSGASPTPTETGDAPVRIRTAGDLWAVLRTGSPAARTAVLQSVVEQPERPVSLGPHEGQDFVDLLLELVPLCSGGFRQLHILCLMCYRDERTSRFFVEEFTHSQDATVVIMLGRRLAVEQGVEFFRPFLGSDSSARVLAAAEICAGDESLEAKELLRIAIVGDGKYDAPPVADDTLDQWMTEIRGPHRLRVRRLARGRGLEALHFWSRWDELPVEEQEWLMALTADLSAEVLVRELDVRLRAGSVSPHLVRQALECGLELPESLRDHEDPYVRSAAISRGFADHQLERYLGPDATPFEAVAAATRCDSPRLLELLSDPRWQVRAKATDLLVSRGPSSIPHLRDLADSSHAPTRIAAVTALQRLGDEDWLHTTFCSV